MSFISGIETAITNFFSSASDTFTGVVNFGANIINGVQNAVQGVVNSIANIAQGLYNGLLTIGSDIVNFFGQLGGAIWHALVSFGITIGAYFYTAWHTLSSAVYGVGQRLSNAFEFIGKFFGNAIGAIGIAVHNLGEWLYHGVRSISDALIQIGIFGYNLYLDVRNILTGVWNYIVSYYASQIQSWVNVAHGIETFAGDVIGYFKSLFDDLLYVPEDVSKYVASKISNVVPRVVAYNLFFEEMRALDRVADNLAKNIFLNGKVSPLSRMVPPLLVKFFSPFIAGLTALFTQETLTRFFPEFTGVSPMPRKSTATPPTSSISSLLSSASPLSPITSQFTGSQPSLPPPISVSPPQIQQLQRYVVGVKQVDAIELVQLPTVSNSIRSPFPNTATILEQLGVNGTLVVSPAQVLSLTEQDTVTPIPFAELRIKTVSETDTVDVEFSGGVIVNTYILGIPLCQLPSTLPPGSSFPPSDTIEDNVSLCLEPLSSVGDTANGVSSQFESPAPPSAVKVSDNARASVSLFSSTAPPLAQSVKDSVSGSVSTYQSSTQP